MAFNINAHVILSGPKNIKAVTKSIQTQLGSVDARINLVAPKNLSKQIGSFNKGLSQLNRSITTLQSSATSANTHLQKLGTQFRNLNKASSAMSKSQAGVQKSLANTGHQVKEVANEIQAFGKDAALAIRRFAAFTVATGVVFGFVRAIQSATKAAIDYEREIVKIVQVTGAGAEKIGRLNKTIQQLSVSLGVDANELAELGRIFAQTGQTIDEVGASIRAIARSSLAPSFGEMKNTAEGLIAALAQFNIKASESEAVLASLNAVSKKWAVEAEDMISVIRRAGGVFAASAGQMDDPKKALNELIGIFVAVRSTTRESADTIAVGLRTIFTRIQRRGTIEFLKQFNIELVDARGNFIGLFPAFEQLAKGLDDIIRRGDALTLSAITEELGGVRQVGKLIPAITQFNKALAATKVAGEAAAAGLGKDVALALQPLGKQFEMLQQRFNALIRDITQTKTFQNMAKIALSMANAFLSVAETLKPLVPLMATFAAIKLSKGLFEFGKGFMGGLRKGGGAGGVGGALGGAVTGGGGGGASGGSARSISVQRALTTAIKSNSTLLASNNTALTQLGTQVASNTGAINTTSGRITTVSTQMLGAIGNLINALNRASLSGGPTRTFAKGGYVSGPSHAQGGVPAELEGGEYVIPKGFADGGNVFDIAGKFGLSVIEEGDRGIGSMANMKIQLRQLQKKDPVAFNKLLKIANKGGTKTEDQLQVSGGKGWRGQDNDNIAKFISQDPATEAGPGTSVDNRLLKKAQLTPNKDGKFTAGSVKKQLRAAGAFKPGFPKGSTITASGGDIRALQPNAKDIFQQEIMDKMPAMFTAAVSMLDPPFPVGGDIPFENLVEKGAEEAVKGTFFETFIRRALRSELSAADKKTGGLFDFPSLKGKEGAFASLFGGGNEPNEFKNTSNEAQVASTYGKAIKHGRKIQQLAAGGSIFAPQGTDTIPAMLTPGEFVINKKSAQSFGYGNLKKINNYATGGTVGVPRKTSAPVKKKATGKKKFVEKSRFMTMNMATGGQDGDDWKATFVGTANAPDEIARGKKILGMDGYLDFDAASSEFGLHILHTDELSIPSLKKQGYGSAAYKKLYDWTVKKQIGFFSDGSVSTSAAKVWQNLKKHYGIPIEQIATNIHENRIPTSPTGEMRLGTHDDVDALFGVRPFAAGGIAQHLAGGTGGRGVQMLKHPPPPAPKRKVPRKKQRKLFSTGPVEIYHGSNSGPDDSIEQSFLQSGASSQLAGGYGQGAGFYGWSDYSTAKGHAKGASAEGRTFESGASTAGRPMVVVVKSIMEPRQWDLDYELNNALVNKWLYNNWDKVKDDLSGIINVKRSKKFEGNYETPSGKMAKRKGLRLTGSAAMKKDFAAGGARGEAMSGTPKLMTKGGGNIREAAATGTVMNELQKGTNKELMHAFEERFFANMPRATAVKYTGLSSLPVERIEKFAAGGSVNLPPHGTDTVPAMLTPGEFVVNRKSAQSFGYGNLKKINAYKKGGGVAVAGKHYYGGDDPPPMAMPVTIDEINTALTKLAGLADAAVLLEQEFKSGAKTLEEYETEQKELTKETKVLVTALDESADSGFLTRPETEQAAVSGGIVEDKDKEMKATKKTRKAADDAAEKMGHLTAGVSSAVGAVAGFSAALSGLDFSSPEAAMASLMSMSFAVSQAQAAISSFTAMAKLSTAATAASTSSEWAETSANLAAAKSEFMKGFRGGFENIFGRLADRLAPGVSGPVRPGTGLLGGIQNMFGGSGGAGGLGGATRALSGVVARLGPMVGKLAAGGLVGTVASMLIGPIGNALSDAILGAKVEIAPGVSGRRGVSGNQAGTAGALVQGAQGAAMGAAIGMAVAGPVGLAVGAIVGGLAGAAKGFFTEKFAQIEFNAFLELQKSMKDLGKSFENLAKLGNAAGAEALKHVNDKLEKGIDNLLQAYDAAKVKGFVDSLFSFSSMLTAGNIFNMSGIAAGFASGGKEGAMDALRQQEYSRIGATEGGGVAGFFGGLGNIRDQIVSSGIGSKMPGVGTIQMVEGLLDKIPGRFGKAVQGTFDVVTGGVSGAKDRIAKRAEAGEAILSSKALQSAASQITPEMFKQLEDGLRQVMGGLISDLGGLADEASLQALAGLETRDDAGLNTEKINQSLATLQGTLGGIGGAAGEFAKELDRMVKNSLKIHMIKDIADKLAIMKDSDPQGAKDLSRAFMQLNKNGGIAKKSIGDINREISELEVTRRSGESDEDFKARNKEFQKEMHDMVESRRAEALEMARAMAQQQLVELAAKKARRAIDALAAGLDHFAAKTSGIAGQTSMLADQIEAEFAQITGEKTIGQLQQFNPFANPTAASDQQIDSAISQLQTLGGNEEGSAAFRQLGGLVKAQRDLPLIMRNVLNDLQLGRKAGDTVSNQEVQDAIIGTKATETTAGTGLLGAGIDLPPQAMQALVATLQGAVQREGGEVFSMDALTKLFESEGDVLKVLGEISAKAAVQLGKAFDALGSFKNSLLKVARIQEQMAKHRMASELAILGKQEAIRDRVNAALEKSPDAFGQATQDLQKRMTIMMGGGLKPGEATTPFTGDMFDPAAMFGHLDTLDDKREKLREKMGLLPGQEMETVLGGDASQMTAEMRANSEELKNLNREINGTEAALKELANDTRLLAAIEGKIHEQKVREGAAKSTVVTMLDALNKLNKGEMSPEEFNKTITGPLTTVEKAFSGETLSFDEGTDLLTRIESGDKLIGGRIRTKTEAIAKERGIDPSDTDAMKDIRDEVVQGLLANLGGAGRALAESMGMDNYSAIIGEELDRMFEAQDEAERLGTVMQSVGDRQIDILQRTMDREEAKMAAVLDKADAGFQKAATEFSAAVKEFALFRGGITDAELQGLDIDVEDAQTQVTQSEAQVKALKEGKDAAIAAKGDEAAKAAEDKAREQGLSAGTIQKKGQAARESAEREEEQNQIRLIRDAESRVKIDQNKLTAQKDLRKRAKDQQDADKKGQQINDERQAEIDAARDEDQARVDRREAATATAEDARATDQQRNLAREEIRQIDAEQQTVDAERATAETERPAETQVGDMTLCCSDITVRLDTIIGLLGGASTVQQLSPATSSPAVPQGIPQLEERPSTYSERVRGVFNNFVGSLFPELNAALAEAAAEAAAGGVAPAVPAIAPVVSEAAAGATVATAAEIASLSDEEFDERRRQADVKPYAEGYAPGRFSGEHDFTGKTREDIAEEIEKKELQDRATALDIKTDKIVRNTPAERGAAVRHSNRPVSLGGLGNRNWTEESVSLRREDKTNEELRKDIEAENMRRGPAAVPVTGPAAVPVTEPAGAAAAVAAQDQEASVTAAGGCCSDILTRLDKIIALLGVGGPPSEAAAASDISAEEFNKVIAAPAAAAQAESDKQAPVPAWVEAAAKRAKLEEKVKNRGFTTSDEEADEAQKELDRMDNAAGIGPPTAPPVVDPFADHPALAALIEPPPTAEAAAVPAIVADAVSAAWPAAEVDMTDPKHLRKTAPAGGETGGQKGKRVTDESLKRNRLGLKGKDTLSKFKEKQKQKEINIGSSAGLRPGDTAGRLSAFREAAAISPRGRMGGAKGAGGRIENMSNRRKAKIEKREARIKKRASTGPGFTGPGTEGKVSASDAIEGSIAKKDQRIRNMKKTLKGLDSDSPRAKKIQANIKRAEAEKNKLKSRLPPTAGEVAQQEQAKEGVAAGTYRGGGPGTEVAPVTPGATEQARRDAGQVNLENERQQREQQGAATGGGAVASKAPVVDKPKPAAAGGNVLEELRKIMQGEELAKSITTALNVGGTDVADQIKLAFKDVIPPKIEMTGELGVIKVHLTGGEILQKFNATIIKTIKDEVDKGVQRALKPEARNDGPGAKHAGANNNGNP